MLALLAQSAPQPLTAEWQGGLISFGVLILIALNIWDKLKRKPAVDEIFDKKLQAQSDQTDKKIEALDRRRENGERDIRDLIYREIGAMKEFISDKITENRENNVAAFGKIDGRLDSFQVTMQGLSNDVMHQIGSLEGQLKEVAKRVA
jgi:hypothetical protein